MTTALNLIRWKTLQRVLVLCACCLAGHRAEAQEVVVSLSWFAYAVNETNATVSITVNRGGETNGAFTVDYMTMDGTATAGVDYIAQGGTLAFAAGVDRRIVTIATLDDGLMEGDEWFLLQLSNPSDGVTLGYWPAGTIYLSDNESPSVVDPSFNPGAGSRSDIHALALQPDGKLIIAGQFTAFDNTNRNRIARLNADGSLDLSFDPGTGADGDIYAVALQPDGRVLVGGAFTSINGVTNRSVARLNGDGTMDATFTVDLNIDDELRALALQPDGKVLIAGHFTHVAGQTRGRVARLNANGTLDTTFGSGSGANDRVRSMALQSDGRILIGGKFLAWNGVSRPRLARLLSNGAVDESFNPGSGADDMVRVIAVQDDGKIYIGGDFEIYNGMFRSAVARLLADGSLDVGFDQGDPENDVVRAIAVQPDGQVWIGGSFTAAGGASRRNLALLDASGQASTQPSGAWSVDDEVFAILLQADGRILIGGEFHDVNGVGRSHIARLHPDWSTNTIDFTTPAFIGYEAAGSATITVQRHGQSSNAVSIAYATADGTAVAGVDYIATSGTLDFAPLETVRYFVVPLLDTGPGQPARTVELYLGPTAAAALAGPLAKAVLSITNNAGQIDFSTLSVTVGEEEASIVLTLVRRGKFSQEVTVDYTTADGTATAGLDYGGQTGTITFPAEDDLVECDDDRDNCFRPRQESYQYIVLPILNDAINEGDEDFTVILSNPRGGAILGGATNIVVTIRDNELGVGFSFQFSHASEWSDVACVTVEKQSDTTNVVTVEYFTRDRTATAGLDYVAQHGTLTFGPADQRQSICIPLLNDALVEGTESFDVILTNVTGGPFLLNNSYTLDYFDNDGPIEFTATLYATRALPGAATVFVRRNDDGTNAATAEYITHDGTARAGVDYVPGFGTLTLSNGQTTSAITVQILANDLASTGRTFTVELVRVSSNVSLGTQSNALVKILNVAQPGDLDPEFSPAPPERLSAISVQPDGKVLVAARGGLLRLNRDGTADNSFRSSIPFDIGPQAFRIVFAIGVEQDGRILFGGRIVYPGGTFALAFISREESDGTGEYLSFLGYSQLYRGGVNCFLTQPDGRVLIGGGYWVAEGDYAVSYLKADLTPDSTWPSTTLNSYDAEIYVVTFQSDRKLILGGEFASINGVSRSRFARLNGDGTLDESFFHPEMGNQCDAPVRRIKVLPDGKILVAGEFTTIQGAAKPFLARLNADGTVDTGFPAGPGPNGSIFALAVQADGGILIGGDFTQVDGLSRPHLARLLANGAVDETFDPGLGPNGPVYDLALLPDGDLIIFGGFDTVNGVPRNQLARIHSYELNLDLPTRLADGQVLIHIHGQPGARFITQVSTNLSTWSPLATNTFSSGSFTVTDSSVSGSSVRFYRAVR